MSSALGEAERGGGLAIGRLAQLGQLARTGWRNGAIATGIALVARLAVAAWAGSRFPAVGDGFYYDTLARRLAAGDGYTWLWADGAVTNVAHYPVGYPAILALAYVLLGARPLSAMFVNAIFGGAMTLGVHRLLAGAPPPQSNRPPVILSEAKDPTGTATSVGSFGLRPQDDSEGGWRGTSGGSPRATAAAPWAALVVGLHPALVPYTAAIMTEGIAAALVVIAVACARGRFSRARLGWGLAGLALGVATLVRPQSLAFAPLLGLLAPSPATWKSRLRSAALTTAIAFAVCAPWTARNCVAMHRCALVSVNGGWNLLIGAQTTNGAWQAAVVPEGCRTVWDEAAKDTCFGQAAREEILRAPVVWLGRAPAKLAATLDYFGAAPWYLHEANPGAFGDRAKVVLGSVETVVSVLLLVLALARAAAAVGPRRGLRVGVAGAGAVIGLVALHVWVIYAALAAVIAAFGWRSLARAPLVVPWGAVVIVGTMVTHVVFFGAGRYGLIIVPFVTALAVGWPGVRTQDSGA